MYILLVVIPPRAWIQSSLQRYIFLCAPLLRRGTVTSQRRSESLRDNLNKFEPTNSREAYLKLEKVFEKLQNMSVHVNLWIKKHKIPGVCFTMKCFRSCPVVMLFHAVSSETRPTKQTNKPHIAFSTPMFWYIGTLAVWTISRLSNVWKLTTSWKWSHFTSQHQGIKGKFLPLIGQ